MKNNTSTIKVGTFFSGIGSPEKALQKLKKEKIIKDYKVEFFSEIDKFAVKSYCAIHNIDKKLNLGDIKQIKGEKLPYCDLWIGGFPCQDISNAGKQKGFSLESSSRSSLGWEMIRLLKEVKEKPKFVIFENVAAITSKKFKNTLNFFKNDLIKLGYTVYDDILIASNYEIPQNRKRYFLVAILNNQNIYTFEKGTFTYKKMKDLLDKKVDERYYLTNSFILKNNNIVLGYKGKPYKIDIKKYKNGGLCGKDLLGKFNQSTRIFSENGLAPTLTASNTAENCKILVNEGKYRIRKITAKETWKLMGFTAEDYYKASNVVSESQLYHQAGNSIVVNVMYAVLKQLFI